MEEWRRRGRNWRIDNLRDTCGHPLSPSQTTAFANQRGNREDTPSQTIGTTTAHDETSLPKKLATPCCRGEQECVAQLRGGQDKRRAFSKSSGLVAGKVTPVGVVEGHNR
ncbi:unnamed protein product [Arctogadus glacialis]